MNPLDRDDLKHQFDLDGYVVAPFYTEANRLVFETFAIAWVRDVLASGTNSPIDLLPLEQYHEWGEAIGIDHQRALQARNRCCVPPASVARAVLSEDLMMFLDVLPGRPTRCWDEGAGWLPDLADIRGKIGRASCRERV